MIVDNTVKSRRLKTNPSSKPIQFVVPPVNPNPIYDYKTKNRSFIRTAKQLELLGIKNHSFHLILINPLLQGVDPHSKDLHPQQVAWIIQECSVNIFYYLREVVRIDESGSPQKVRFRMDRGTLAALYCFYNNINFYLIKPRQTGKTVGIEAMLSWAFKFSGPNADFMFSGNEEGIGKKNLKGMKNILRNLPSYMTKMGTTAKNNLGKTIRTTDNIKTYSEPSQNNTAVVAKCASTEDSAETIGRGYTQSYQFFDEAEFTKYIDIIVKVSGMSFNTASQNAAKNGSGYCRIFATTPGNLGDKKACQSALKIVDDSLPWDEKFYDNLEELKVKLAAKSKFKVVYIEYDYKQLGLGEEWFINACGNVGGDTDKIRREILLQRFAGNSNSPFTKDEIEELETNMMKPIGIKKFGKIYEILFYEKPKKGRKYFIGIDPSDGTGGDNYAMTVIDPYTLNTVAEFKSPYMTEQDIVDLTVWLSKKYFYEPLIIVERNRNGGAVVNLFKKSELRHCIYAAPEASGDNSMIRDTLDENGFIKEEFVRNKYFGQNTTTKTRQVMMNILLDAVHFAKNIVRSKYLVEDIKNLVVKNEKIQAAQGEHDDSVMSWLIAMYIYYHGEKLERYGFRKGDVPRDIQETDEFAQLKKLYQNPEIKRQFPTFYTYYKEEIEKKKLIEAVNVEKHGKHDSTEGIVLGNMRKVLKEADNDFLEDIDEVPVNNGMNDRGDWSYRKKALIEKFKSLNG